MPEFLLELFSEEIPARMQAQGAKDLERLVVGALTDRGLLFESVRSFAGPRRLTLAIGGLPAKQPDVSEEKKGPRVGAPEKAIEGFLKSAGLTLDQCQKQSDAKGEFYVAVIARKGRATAEVLAGLLPEAIAKLPWPKSMRWPVESKEGTARWVRPLHGIVATFDGEVVPFEFAGVKSGNVTHGHRFLSSGAIAVRRFDDYVDKLRSAHVIVDAAERRETILHEAKQKAFALGLELVEDEGLLSEVAGLAEWPVVLVGTIDAAFMDLPPEILQTTMRAHQKYFALRHPENGKLANRFAVVANMAAEDGGKEIVAGNERVLRARLADAKFFWDQDRKMRLDDRIEALEGIVFNAKLGSQFERAERVADLAMFITSKLGLSSVDGAIAARAAMLAKADLTTGVVGEFPDLQGIMGRYYAIHFNHEQVIADAIRDHYKPVGPTDSVPTKGISVAVALADKFDTLVAFWAIGEKPTGSKDPYALRRAALGAIRIILTNEVRLPLGEVFVLAADSVAEHLRDPDLDRDFEAAEQLDQSLGGGSRVDEVINADLARSSDAFGRSPQKTDAVLGDLLAFFADRLKVALREKGTRHDLIDAVFSLGNEDDLVRLVARVEALQAFLKTDDGANLLAGYKRAANILKIEEKKEKNYKGEYRGEPDVKALKEEAEKELAETLAEAKAGSATALYAEDFVGAMSALAKLRAPVDRFFDKVTVNVDDEALRENRLKLLSQIVDTAHQVADFSKIEG